MTEECKLANILKAFEPLNNMEIPEYLHGIANNILACEQLEAERKSLWAAILKLVPHKDGDKWCVLYGEDLQSGICAFGDTPSAEMCAFDSEMGKP